MPISDKQLLILIKENGFLETEQLKKAISKVKQEKVSLYEALLQLDLLSDKNLGNLISDYLKVPFVVLSKVKIDPFVLKIIPENLASKFKSIAFSVDEKGLNIATSNPGSSGFFDLVSKKADLPVVLYYATERDLEDSLKLYKQSLKSEFDRLLGSSDFKKELAGQVDEAGKAVSKEAPVKKIVDTLIEYAYQNRASDIHIEPAEVDSLVRFRIDGVLSDVLSLPRSLHDQVITRIKVLSKLRTDEHLSSQDGKLQIKLPAEELDIRVSIVPIVDGEKVVMRLLTSHYRSFALTDLGMNDSDLKKVRSGFEKPYGMILSTGPTGSGKTTSMYSILKILNNRDVNIATIEDPVEYDILGLNQIQVNPKTNLTFADGLRSILRQDPDIIYVGEIRDEETADIAINSAMTGHLVLSTLHTNDAATALPRLIDMKVEPFLVASTVNVIIGQRLIRQICEKCKVSSEFRKEGEKWMGEGKVASEISLLNPELISKYLGQGDVIRLYHGKGCPVCHDTGYVGRIGIFEVLVVSSAIQELITKKSDSEMIMKQAQAEGMSTMLEDGLMKVQEGITTIEEVLRATKVE